MMLKFQKSWSDIGDSIFITTFLRKDTNEGKQLHNLEETKRE